MVYTMVMMIDMCRREHNTDLDFGIPTDRPYTPSAISGNYICEKDCPMLTHRWFSKPPVEPRDIYIVINPFVTLLLHKI